MTSADMPDSAAARPALRRDSERRLLLGVCAGLARVLDTDPVLIRGAAIVIGLFAGPLALIAYVAAALIVPRDDGRMLLSGDPPDRRESRLGWGGVVVASILLLASAPHFDGWRIEQPFSSPLLIVALVAGVIVLARANAERAKADKREAAAFAAGPDAPTAERAAGADPQDQPTTEATVPGEEKTVTNTREGSALAPTGTAVEAATPEAIDAMVRVAATRAPAAGRLASGPGGGSGAPPTIEMPAPPSATPPPTPPRPTPERPRGRSVFLSMCGVIVSGAAVAVVLDASGAVDLRASTVAILLGAGALVCGLAAAITAGRRGTVPTLALGIVLAIGAAGVAALDSQLDDGIGERQIRPSSVADLKPEYRLGVGQLDLDLRDTNLPAGVTPLKASLGAGEIQLRVAPDVTVESVGDSGVHGRLQPLVAPKAGAAPILRLDAHIGVGGSVDVVRDGG